MRLFYLPLALVLCVGCAALHVEDPRFVDAGHSVDPGPDGPGNVSDGGVDDALPRVTIDAPVDGDQVLDALALRGTASDDRGVAAVFVKVGPNVPVLAASSDGYGHFTFASPVPQGPFVVEAIAHDIAGQIGEPARVSLMGPTTGSDDQAPTLTVDSPADGSAPLHAQVLVQGTASDDRAVVSMDVWHNGALASDGRVVETGDFFAHWSRLVTLVPGIDNTLRFVARDAGGREAELTITLFGRAEIDREPPVLVVSTPSDGDTVSADRITVQGTAEDEVGMREVKLRVGSTPAGTGNLLWSEYQPVSSSNGFLDWTSQVVLPVGAVSLEVRAIDVNGLGTSVTLGLTNSFVPVYSDEVEIPLALRDATAPTLHFELDEAGVNEVISAEIQKETTLLSLDTTPLLTNAVNEIKSSCGEAWRQNNENPNHNCTLTELGRTFGQAQGVPWQQSAEYSLVRLLTMTPKNSVVDGTSIDGLEDIADDLNVGGGFHEILADTLGIGITSEVISTPNVVRALQNYWMAGHPEVQAGARMPITLWDGMNDLAPLKDRFGPKGSHPGLLDPSFTPRSEVFGPGFQLLLGAESNLRWKDGVDLTGKNGVVTKDYIALVEDRVGPDYDDVLEFDFTDPNKFDVEGLIDDPRVDLRMSMQENTGWINSCLPSRGGDAGCKGNLPNSPLGGYIWAQPRWQVETLIAGSAYEQYKTRANVRNEYRWLLGIIKAAEVTVGQNNPAGWSTFDTFLSIGSPPEDQYLWELILEVGQRALHNFSGQTLAEGRANVAFTLRNIDVGLSANDIRAAMRPELQRQRHKLSDRLLGDYEKNNGDVDFFYGRGADGAPYLFFAAASDPLPNGEYSYQKPGFFADEALTQKRSSTAAGTSGDSVHEKLALPEGETTLYAQDETGSTFRLRFVVSGTSVTAFVARKVR